MNPSSFTEITPSHIDTRHTMNATPVHTDFNPTQAVSLSRGKLWTGRIMSLLPVLFLIMDGVMKLLKPAVVVEATVKLGYPESVIVVLGIVLLAGVVLYLVPRTAVLGAILLTGYLGGAVATHVRVGDPLFSHILFPIYIAVLLWGGLWLRNERVRAMLRLCD